MFLLLFVSRGMDFLSTWVATPNMVLEGNPIAKKLGWKWGIPLNLALCFGFAFWPLPAIVISTTSVLVAARNFQSAWLMRSLGEQIYRDWHVERVQETSVTLYLFCLFAQTALTGGVGVAVIYFSEWRLVPLAIGLGIVAYALAVAFYTLLGIWRMRRSAIGPPGWRNETCRSQLAPAHRQRTGSLAGYAPREDVRTSGEIDRSRSTCIPPHSKSSSSWPPRATSSPSPANCWRTSKPRSRPIARSAGRASRSCSSRSRAANILGAIRSWAATRARLSGRWAAAWR